MSISREPYPFNVAFEAALVTLLCSRPRLFGRLGREIEADLLSSKSATLAVQAAQAIAHDTGNGPDSLLTVLQRIRRWVYEGKHTIEELEAVSDLFDEAEDAGLPSEEQVVAEAAPILQRRLQAQATRTAIEEYGRRGDMSKVIDLVARSARLGTVDTSVGLQMGDTAFREIDRVRLMERLPVGILELDAGLDGGLQRGGLGIALGGPGDGKSMFLSHGAAHAMLRGLRVGYATLELPEVVVSARIFGNLVGVPVSEILAGRHDVARARWSELGVSGSCVVKEFPASVTSVEDIQDWVRLVEDHQHAPLDLLIVDYVDKLANPRKDGRELGGYEGGRHNTEGLRLFAFEKKNWCWTASQSRRRDKGAKKHFLDLDDTADSMHKPRVADLVVSLNAQDGGATMTFFVAKHRTGRARFSVGPLPTEFELGRVAPVLLEDGTLAGLEDIL